MIMTQSGKLGLVNLYSVYDRKWAKFDKKLTIALIIIILF